MKFKSLILIISLLLLLLTAIARTSVKTPAPVKQEQKKPATNEPENLPATSSDVYYDASSDELC